MVVHLLKVCVGVSSVATLARFQRERAAAQRTAGKRLRSWHMTRHRPKRAEEVIAGGSLYWIIAGAIRARQRILAIESPRPDSEDHRCRLVLDSKVVRVVPVPRSPHQGWRYFKATDAPPDLARRSGSAVDPPPELAAELRALGLL
ncbi:MAG: DUF1489 family protein [Alphaproteobacteria bacterium]|nr:DUF1489 family protein [Alphaproteobacteria bacterium]